MAEWLDKILAKEEIYNPIINKSHCDIIQGKRKKNQYGQQYKIFYKKTVKHFSLSNPADRHSFPERYDILSGKFLENFFYVKNETWSCPDTVGFAELLWRFMKIFLEGLRKIAGRGKPDTSGNLFDAVIGCEQQVTRRRQPNFV